MPRISNLRSVMTALAVTLLASTLLLAHAQPSGTLVWGINSDVVGNSWLDTKPEQSVYQTMFNALVRYSPQDFSIQPELASTVLLLHPL